MTTLIGGDHRTQTEVLEGMAEAVNHRKWFAEFARPYLGEHPIEIGSGFGDYAAEWLPNVKRFTVTEGDDDRLVALKERFANDDRVSVRQILLPTEQTADHSSLVTLNVLEHIEEDVAALRAMGQLVRPGAPIVVVVPAFPIAMSRIDYATGHVRRYTKRSLTEAMTAAGLTVERMQYANSIGFLCYFLAAKILRMAPSPGKMMSVYDRFVVPANRWMESKVQPPFGQSVVAIARTPVER